MDLEGRVCGGYIMIRFTATVCALRVCVFGC